MEKKNAGSFSENVCNAFLFMRSVDHLESCFIEKKNNDIIIKSGPSFIATEITLTLHNVAFLGDIDFENTFFDYTESNPSYSEDYYVYELKTFNFIYDKDSFVKIIFESAEAEIKLFKINAFLSFNSQPWQYLIRFASCILERSRLSEEIICRDERNILSLAKELEMLDDFYILNKKENSQAISLPIIKEKAKAYGFENLTEYIAFYETSQSEQKKLKALEKLLAELNTVKHEPLWRDIFERLDASQKEYPDVCDVYVPERIRKETYTVIENFFNNIGYKGKFPDFYRQGKMKGVKLAYYENQSYTIGSCSACYHIHCCEEYRFEDNAYEIQFVTGTQLLRKEEAPEDVYYCMFDSKGHTFFNSVWYWNSDYDLSVFDSECKIYKAMEIAVLKAEQKRIPEDLQRLNGIYYSYDTSGRNPFKFYLVLFLFAGGLFGMVLSMGLFVGFFLLTIIIEGKEGIAGTVQAFPWLLCLLGGGGAFGLAVCLAERFKNSK